MAWPVSDLVSPVGPWPPAAAAAWCLSSPSSVASPRLCKGGLGAESKGSPGGRSPTPGSGVRACLCSTDASGPLPAPTGLSPPGRQGVRTGDPTARAAPWTDGPASFSEGPAAAPTGPGAHGAGPWGRGRGCTCPRPLAPRQASVMRLSQRFPAREQWERKVPEAGKQAGGPEPLDTGLRDPRLLEQPGGLGGPLSAKQGSGTGTPGGSCSEGVGRRPPGTEEKAEWARGYGRGGRAGAWGRAVTACRRGRAALHPLAWLRFTAWTPLGTPELDGPRRPSGVTPATAAQPGPLSCSS